MNRLDPNDITNDVRLTVTVTDVSGNVATQVVNVTVATGTTTLGYDANGNQTNDAVWSYSYDLENRLTSAVSASSSPGSRP